MTDIKQAIADLRDAINSGEGWPTIHLAYDALDKSVLERYGVNNPIDAMRQLDWALTKSATGTFVNVETYLKQLEEAVCVPSVTVIQAARDVISQSGPIIINEGRSNEVEVYTTDEKAIAALRAALDAFGSSVEGGTVDMTDRIAAAAEEIEGVIEKVIKNGFNQYEKQSGIFIPITIKWDRGKFTAIITRHIQGGK